MGALITTGWQGESVIQHYESIHDGDLTKIGYQPKECPSGIWTVGWGHALFDAMGMPLTGQDGYLKIAKLFPQYSNMDLNQANTLFRQDLVKYEAAVNKNLKRKLLQHEYGALVSFSFNCGYSQTLFSMINANEDIQKICAWWESHYITSNGVVKNGLIFRRKTEALLYKTGVVEFYN